MTNTTEQWNVFEQHFSSSKAYGNPYQDLELDVVFRDADGLELVMPAFWNGDDTWAVRFAPPRVGRWSFTTRCSDLENEGLNAQSGTFEAIPYTGELALYRHGFLRVSQNKRYLEHDDGTPFYWLGDTHWLGLSAKERFEESNDSRFASQFKGIIDRRLEQGYTVWAGSLMIGEWNDASGSPTPLWGTHLENGQHPWVGTGYQITASSGVHQEAFTGFSEGHAIDGYADSRWASNLETFPQWLRLNLGRSLKIARIELQFPTRERWAYRIEGSNLENPKDDQDFEILLEQQSDLEADSFVETVSGQYQFLRLVITGSSGSAASLNAFQVFDADGVLHGNQQVLKVLNPAYWQLLDRRIQHIAKSGLLLNLGLDWGRNLQRSPAMLEDYQRVARYVLARYGAYPSVYFTAGEPQQSPNFEGWKTLLEGVYDLDPYKRPATLHTFKLPDSRGAVNAIGTLRNPVDRSARGFAFTHLQTEEYGQGSHELEEWCGEYHAKPTMPMIEAETGYEKSAGDGYEPRWAAWQSQMAGACGYTYGAYGIWSATWDNDDHWNEFGTHTNWFDAIDFMGGEQMRHVKGFFSAIPWQTLEPAPDAITWNDAPTAPRERPMSKASGDRSTIVAYLPRTNGAYTGMVTQLGNPSKRRARWFNPRTGEFSSITTNLAVQEKTFLLPHQPDHQQDWVLLIDHLTHETH